MLATVALQGATFARPRHHPLATSASQTYIARLGFQDRDRSNARHGLACEYLFDRLLELEVAPSALASHQAYLRCRIGEVEGQLAHMRLFPSEIEAANAERDRLQQELDALTLDKAVKALRQRHLVGTCINVPITSRSYVNGFADVLIKHEGGDYIPRAWLGEVKITPEPAENVLQQVNFYANYLGPLDTTYILTDYDPAELKRLCVGTTIKVFRLGQRFEDWLATRAMPATEEL